MGGTRSIVNAYVSIERDTEVALGVSVGVGEVIVRVGSYGEFEIVLDRAGLERWEKVIAEARVALERAEADSEGDDAG